VHARRARDRFEEREIVEWLVIALLLGPAPAGGGYERCVELMGTEWEDPLLPVEVAGAAAAFAAMLDRRDEAERLVESARTEMHDADQWIWIVSFWESFISLWYGDAAAAEVALRPAYEALGHVGERSHFSSIAHALASALYAQGRYEEAEALTYECEHASRPNDVHSQVLWRSIRAKTYARREEFEEAERLSLEAVAYGESSDFLHAYADALTDRAEVLELAGDTTGVVRELEHALRVQEEKGNLLGARKTRVRLDSLR
jgi:tetratricopeptide (TPR) repeat protein